MKTDPTFWSDMAVKYAAQPIKDQAAYERTLDRVRAWLPPRAEVVEFGCGTGSTALLLARSARHITATDYAEGMIAIANGKLDGGKVDNVTFLTAAVDDAQIPDASYDAVLSFSLLHLLPDLEGALARMRDRLRPDGLLIVKAACLGGRYQVMRPLIWAMQLVGKAPYVRIMTPAQMERLIADAGFEILETGDFPAHPPSHFVVARRA